MIVAERMVALHQTLVGADVPHAFGGALALGWCIDQPRGTVDIDLNLFIPPDRAGPVLDTLPPEVRITDEDRKLVDRDGQARLWWKETPVDVFTNTTDFHDRAARRVRWETFASTELPFLDCTDLAVFKAFFNRTKDWADLEAMVAAGTIDRHEVITVIGHLLGRDDERVERLATLDPLF